jgi:hypothetical protein
MQHTRTIKEAAAHYRAADPNTALTEYAIRTLVRTGRVPCACVGKKYLVTIKVLDAYLTGSAPPPEPPRTREWRIR